MTDSLKKRGGILKRSKEGSILRTNKNSFQSDLESISLLQYEGGSINSDQPAPGEY